MSRIADVSNVLGEYMLKGWTLTDQVCPTPGCVVPLLRSRDRSVTFCANCDGSPEAAVERGSGSRAVHMDSSLAPPAHTSITAQPSSPTSTPHSPLSLHSTPPTTPPSRSPSLPALPDPSPLTLQRRAQSDLASQRIGDRLLKGWAMLGEECPSDTCWGVPLVRKPGRAKGGRGDGGECVICGWGSEADGRGASAAGPSTARAAIRSPGAEDMVHTFHPTPTPPLPRPVTARLARSPAPAASSARAAHLDSTPLLPGSSISHSVDALNQTLSTLSERLTVLSANPITADPIVIRTLVEAMGAVMDALAKARAMDM